LRLLPFLHFVCDNCSTHSDNTVAWIALGVSVGVLFVNVVLALATWRSATGTQREAEATERQAAAMQRPVLVPVVDPSGTVSYPEGPDVHHVPAVPQPILPRRRAILLPVKNIGTGPAFDMELVVVVRDDATGGVDETHGEQEYKTNLKIYAIAAGDTVGEILVWIPKGVSNVPSFDLKINYRDLAGSGWRTSAKYQMGGEDGKYGTYKDPSIEGPFATPSETYGSFAPLPAA
jgi:hypothetical protein